MRAQPYIPVTPRGIIMAWNSSGSAKELSGISTNEIPTLGCVSHCSWCSQLVVAGITRCSVGHTALWDNMCEHRCFPTKPEVLNANWNQLLTCVVPEKCSELTKRILEQSAPLFLFLFFSPHLQYRDSLCMNRQDLYIFYIWKTMTFMRWEKNQSGFPCNCVVFSSASHRVSRDSSTAQPFPMF